MLYEESLGIRDAYPDARSLNTTLPNGEKNAYKYKVAVKAKGATSAQLKLALKNDGVGDDSD
jgi:hypothetical protein